MDWARLTRNGAFPSEVGFSFSIINQENILETCLYSNPMHTVPQVRCLSWVKLNMVHTHGRRRKGGEEGVRERGQREEGREGEWKEGKGEKGSERREGEGEREEGRGWKWSKAAGEWAMLDKAWNMQGIRVHTVCSRTDICSSLATSNTWSGKLIGCKIDLAEIKDRWKLVFKFSPIYKWNRSQIFLFFLSSLLSKKYSKLNKHNALLAPLKTITLTLFQTELCFYSIKFQIALKMFSQ